MLPAWLVVLLAILARRAAPCDESLEREATRSIERKFDRLIFASPCLCRRKCRRRRFRPRQRFDALRSPDALRYARDVTAGRWGLWWRGGESGYRVVHVDGACDSESGQRGRTAELAVSPVLD